MSQDERNRIIAENVPKLIKCLLKSQKEGTIFRTCEQFAWSQIRSNRNISVNGHAVRRDVDALAERFLVDNMPEFADYFKLLCEFIFEHPACVEHYELDIHYAIIDFMLSLANTPVKATRHNIAQRNVQRLRLIEKLGGGDSLISIQNLKLMASKTMVDSLKEDFIQETRNIDDSDLSEWSDGNIESDEDTSTIKDVENSRSTAVPQRKNIISNIKPPQRELPYKPYENTEQLKKCVDANFWQSKFTILSQTESQMLLANFAIVYVQYLNYLAEKPVFDYPSTATEHFLLREIIFMFFAPRDCMFFQISQGKIFVKNNVSVNSVTQIGLKLYLESNILEPLNLMKELRQMLHDSVDYLAAPHTVEGFVSAVRSLLKPVKDKLISYELRLIDQNDSDVNTLITFTLFMQKSFELLRLLHLMCKRSLIINPEVPPHVKSMYLLSRLYEYARIYNNKRCIALYLLSLKTYCGIVDTWWQREVLEDWKDEFICECTFTAGRMLVLRPLDTLIIGYDVAKVIQNCPLYKLMSTYALQAGETQSLLSEIHLLDDMLQACAEFSEKPLYYKLRDKVIDSFTKFHLIAHNSLNNDCEKSQTEDSSETEDKTNCDSRKILVNDIDTNNKPSSMSTSSNEFVMRKLATVTTDVHLLNAFYANFSEITTTTNCIDITQLVELFEKVGLAPQLYNLAYKKLEGILNSRIRFANGYVVGLFRDQFRIGMHVQHIRNIVLLEANYAMHAFYDQLFQEIESRKQWANGVLLTMKLDDIVSSKFPEMSSLIRIEITSVVDARTDKVCQAVDAFMMTYNLCPALMRVITQQDIKKYNMIMSMLLKVKWSVWKLEKLRFPRRRTQNLFAELKLIDILVRRLEQLRFWLFYVINNLHSHIYTNVLLPNGKQFDEDLLHCTNLFELQALHDHYVNTLCQQTLVSSEFSDMYEALDQIFHLIYVVNMEWVSCTNYLEEIESALNIDISIESNSTQSDYLTSNQLDEIELTYVRCHQLLADKLSHRVNNNQCEFLKSLSDALNSSLPC